MTERWKRVERLRKPASVVRSQQERHSLGLEETRERVEENSTFLRSPLRADRRKDSRKITGKIPALQVLSWSGHYDDYVTLFIR